ncbi:MAG: hypothetical protein ABWW70_03460 [Thermoproteota archaeon]
MEGLVLVVGVSEDAGKTVLAASLARALKDRGYDVTPVKPAGATEVWRSPYVLRESARRRVLVTADALVLERYAHGIPIEELNPVAAHLVPLSHLPYATNSARGVAEIVPAFRTALLRVTECPPGKGRSTQHFVSSTLASARQTRMVAGLLDVARLLSPEPSMLDVEEVAAILSGPAADKADTCLRKIIEEHGAVIVESNSDVAAPTKLSLEKASMVVVAAHGLVSAFPGDRWRLAVEVRVAGLPPWSVSTDSVVKLLRPIAEVELPLLEEPDPELLASYLDPLVKAYERVGSGTV